MPAEGVNTVKLLYWDIDGTLLNTGRAGLYAIEEVFHDLKGTDVPVPKIAAGVPVSREDIVALGEGGLCLGCKPCHWPSCPFGK